MYDCLSCPYRYSCDDYNPDGVSNTCPFGHDDWA